MTSKEYSAETASASSSQNGTNDTVHIGEKQADGALLFLRHNAEALPTSSSEQELQRVRRKVDYRIIPLLFLIYFLNFIDKILLNYANVMGISRDLRLRGNDFSNASSAFWIAVLLAEIPNMFLLQRLSTGKWLGFCLACWGICTACTAGTSNYSGLLTTRILSGAFESTVPPALMQITGRWYVRQELISRVVLWYLGTASGFIFGGLISWAFQNVGSSATLAPWRIMFLALGCFTVIVGICVMVLVPETPMDAKFLRNDEKKALLDHVKQNQTGVCNKQLQSRQIKEAFTDFQLWAQWLIMLLNGGGGGVITAYSSTLIRSFGYMPKQAALLNMGSGGVGITACLLSTLVVRKTGHRWIGIIMVAVPTIIGAGLMSFLSSRNQSGSLAGIYLVNASIAMVPIQFSWMITNVSGQTKRSIGFTVLNAAFALGNIIGPQTFQARDAPTYVPARLSMFIMQCIIVAVSICLVLYYRRQNKIRDARGTATDSSKLSYEEAFQEETDKRRPNFRYAY
ncbi:MFS transporter-like protein 18 [Elsinoe australis]|uniref:MFS transporter-like protein 18 n=1 Tax=Elsinoe australis TaxID=40998 RepID=A0A4U7BA16_9PEZI|nr:MFS transporter-like protein 18 [Elsinoe australis]